MSQETYATCDEYIIATGDDSSPDDRIRMMLESQSAKLRALVGIRSGEGLSEDARTLARDLVIDACRKALVPPTLEGFGSDLAGASTASFSANGFQQSVTLQNPSGSAYFDRSMLSALRRLLGRSMRMGTISPAIGGRNVPR